ncbi:MAG: cupin domain-containing protein [Actinomycetota bacterium]|nr:cupin domain-containing protein [Actinomycetota bacterium]
MTVGSGEGEHVRFGQALGTRRMLGGTDTRGQFGLVEHDLPARQLGSPIHTHANEDEYSFVLSGRLSAQIGVQVIEAGPGELVRKPRGIPHAFWNAGDETVRFLELISPAGFEEYLFELAEPLNRGDEARLGEVIGRYSLDLRMDTVPELVARHGLVSPM